MNTAGKIGIGVTAGIVGILAFGGGSATQQGAQNKVFVSGLATGSGTIANPLGLTVITDSTVTGTGSAGSAFSVLAATSAVTAAAFGYPQDGDITYAVNTTLGNDVFAHDITINGGVTVNPGGYRIWATGTLHLNGNIDRSGPNGATGGSSSLSLGSCNNSTGAGLLGVPGGTLPGVGGSPGNNSSGSTASIFPATSTVTAGAGGPSGSNGSPGNNGPLGTGGSGGGGGGNVGAGAGSTGGTAGGNTAMVAAGGGLDMQALYSGRQPPSTILTPGTGGGAGGCAALLSNVTKQGGRGGTSGGYVVVFAKAIDGSGHIWAKGGNGGDGGGGTAVSAGAGGGGGGAGGVVVIVIGGGTFPAASAAGGTGGAGSGPAGGATTSGGNGGNGGDGYLIEWKAGF